MQRDNWGKWAIIVAFSVIVVAGIVLILSIKNHRVPVSIGDKITYARVADTDSKRQRGLSGTKPLGEGESMLFVFDVPGRWGMWMKDVKYSLDMVWMDSSKKIVHIEPYVTPDTFPKVFLPQKDAQYVIELPAGYVHKNGVAIGQVVTFSVK